ncbi:unnamed protein product [Cuscuta epithymum]|uniref:Uncharacterized protein n=1 Tax=Cuscuta epithymum TaxID=186058 RepID=A0AAV0G562_9ASTE|nr:unnamed protein product [Cuscuta epithymum]
MAITYKKVGGSNNNDNNMGMMMMMTVMVLINMVYVCESSLSRECPKAAYCHCMEECFAKNNGKYGNLDDPAELQGHCEPLCDAKLHASCSDDPQFYCLIDKAAVASLPPN